MQKNKKHDPKRWLILALLNVLAITYPINLYLQAGDDQSQLLASVLLVGTGALLAIGDVVTAVVSLA